MNSILIKALMKHHNDFFKMTPEEQDVWKLEEHDEIDDKIRAFVRDELGSDDDSNVPEEIFEYNKTILEYWGVGDNHFMLNELDQDKDLLNYKSLYEYNTKYHEYQEEACRTDENFPDHEPKELYNRFAAWARALVDGEFNYLNLDSMEIWINWSLDAIGYDWMEENIPYEFESGPDDGKKVDGGYLWDMHINANGLEGWYEQMKDFNYKWIADKYDNLEELGDVVFKVDKTENKYDPSIDYVFGSLNVLKKLTFKNFVNDAAAIEGDNKVLFDYRDKICAEFKSAMDAEFEKVKLTPPNVIPLKKKRKVVMTGDALNDLMGLDHDL